MTEPPPGRPEHLRGIRSYVLREGRMTPAQRRALDDLLPIYGIDLQAAESGFLASFERTAPRIMEIGFGMGDSLFDLATAMPECDFVGVEVHGPGVGHLLQQVERSGLQNLRIYHADALQVLDQCIPVDALQRINIFFPDPWPKKRHRKRRLINETFLQRAADRLAPDGLLHVATDWLPYAEAVREIMADQSRFVAAQPPWRPETKYERRGMRLGHAVTDLAWRQVDRTTPH